MGVVVLGQYMLSCERRHCPRAIADRDVVEMIIGVSAYREQRSLLYLL